MKALLILFGLAFACAANAADDKAATRYAGYIGKFFEVQYPANFKVRVRWMQPRPGSQTQRPSPRPMAQWSSMCSPLNGLVMRRASHWMAAREIEVSRDTKPGKSSGVAGTFTWYHDCRQGQKLHPAATRIFWPPMAASIG